MTTRDAKGRFANKWPTRAQAAAAAEAAIAAKARRFGESYTVQSHAEYPGTVAYVSVANREREIDAAVMLGLKRWRSRYSGVVDRVILEYAADLIEVGAGWSMRPYILDAWREAHA